MNAGKNKKIFAIILSLVFAASMLFAPLTDSVWAEDNEDNDGDAPNKLIYMLKAQSIEDDSEDGEDEDEEGGDPWETGIGVHADPAVFEKNFDLSWEQKKYTIQEIERLVVEDAGITPGMSDLEKYYRLAVAGNQRAQYDWDFWSGRYYFDHYSHQWDSYGVLTERSVCAGIAIFYSHLCHAADLPCWFVRLDPKRLDHTIDFIPNINGNAYYIDVTEDMFFMSEDANPFQPIDKAFSHITTEYTDVTDCTDDTFNFSTEEGSLEPGSIKACWKNNVSYEEWSKEYVYHDPTVTERNFPTAYEEKGSGLPAGEAGHKHISYYDYRSNFVEPGHKQAWFLDDFYKDPAAVEQKILNKEFIINEEENGRLVNVSGVEKNYNCSTKEGLEAAIAEQISDNKISVEYFPSSKTIDGEDVVVPEAAELEIGSDYSIACTSFDLDNRTAELTITGEGDYSGEYKVSVKLNSAVVSKDPVPKKSLTYNGQPKVLIEAGEAANGKMQYAIGDNDKDEPAESEFAETLPERTDAGNYYVWYKVKGNEGYADSAPQCMKNVAKISRISVSIVVDDMINLKIGETAQISPRTDKKVQADYSFESWNEDIATVDENGVVTAVSGGLATIFVSAEVDNPNFEVYDDAMVMVEVEGETDIDDTRVVLSQTAFTYNGKVQKPTIKKIKRRALKEGTDYTATWSNPSSKNAGTYKVTIEGMGSYFGTTDATYTINKAPNPMKLKAKTVKVKRKTLKKKSKSFKRAKAFTVSKAQGKLSYKLASAKKGKKSFKKKFKVNKKTGKITVKKGLKKGTYKVKVKVKANGSANYKAATKTVTIKVRVR